MREVKECKCGEYKRLAKKAKHLSNASNNLKLWLTDFFEFVCDIMPTYENQSGGSVRHLPSWFTKDMVLNKYIMEMESRTTSRVYLGF